MRSVFEQTPLTSLDDIADWNTENVTDMGSMFGSMRNLTNLDFISNWNLNKVTNMGNMFQNCSSLTSVDLSGWNVENLEHSKDMFLNCSSLTGTLDLSKINIKSRSHTQTHDRMFVKCSNLNKIIMPTFKENCYSFPFGCFTDCSNLIEVDLGAFPSKFGKAYYSAGEAPFGFKSNSKLTTISGNFNVGFTKYMESKYYTDDWWITAGWCWFDGCNNIKDINFTGTIYTSADFTDYRIFKKCNTSNFTEATWLSFVSIFPENTDGVTKKICVGSNLNQIPTNYATILTNKGYTLYGAAS